MPGLVKVGYSSDPELRAEELNHTGSPHPYDVDYKMLVEEPHQIEQKAHRALSLKRERKEWFRCSPEDAIAAIKQVVGIAFLSESYIRADREKANQLWAQQKRAHEIEEQIRTEKKAILERYYQLLKTEFSPRPFWIYWMPGALVALLGVAIFFPKATIFGYLVLCAVGGAIIGAMLQSYVENERKNSSEYQSLLRKRDEEIASVTSRADPDRNYGGGGQPGSPPLTNSHTRKEGDPGTCPRCGGPVLDHICWSCRANL